MSMHHNQPEYSVSEIAAAIKRTVEDNFGVVRVRAEISKVSINSASGHGYITLKDDKAVLEAVCWRGVIAKLPHKPEVGMEVIATGKLTTYPGKSQYQLVIDMLEPAGLGALMAMLEARKKQLAAEGLFDAARKKPLPFMPRVIGIVTSPTGAVIRDMLHRIEARFPCRVMLWPVAVQGAGAAEQIAAAIAGFNDLDAEKKIPSPDVLIVARGGGSVEDLWAFNEEIVVRAVAASRIPIISGVGHEPDVTLIDYAADMRAPTPSAAAELAVPVRAECVQAVIAAHARLSPAWFRAVHMWDEKLNMATRTLNHLPRLVDMAQQRLDDISNQLHIALPNTVQRLHDRLEKLTARLSLRTMQDMIMRHEQRVAKAQLQMTHTITSRLDRAIGRTEILATKLATMDVQSLLKRGFVLVKNSAGTLITTRQAMGEKGSAELVFADGNLPIYWPETSVKLKASNKKTDQPSLL